jgi:hypothetical protein
MTAKSDKPWITVTIILAVALGVVLICTGLIVSGVMKLGLSLL